MKNIDESAYPWHNAHSIQPVPGLTIREHAAISLRVPDSGDPELDAMIRKARRWDMATAAMQGFAANPSCSANGERHATEAVQWADALLASLDQPTKEGGTP